MDRFKKRDNIDLPFLEHRAIAKIKLDLFDIRIQPPNFLQHPQFFAGKEARIYRVGEITKS